MIRKLCYDVEILYNKWSPFIISIFLVIYHILHFLLPYDLTWMQYLCLPSMFTALHMYNSRQTFQLCRLHRCFVNYVLGNLIACLIEHYWIVPYMNVYWFGFIIIGTLIAFSTAIYYYYVEIHSKHPQTKSRRTRKWDI